MERQSSLARKALSIFVDQKQLSAKTDLDQREREEEKIILDEAKRAAPVVFAKRGDLFTWECTDRYNSYTRDEYVRVVLNILEGMTHHRDISPHRDGLKLPS